MGFIRVQLFTTLIVAFVALRAFAAPPEVRDVNAAPDNTVRVDSAQKYWYVNQFPSYDFSSS